jgi:hypothetical protein
VEALEGAGRDDLGVLDAETEFARFVGRWVAGVGLRDDGVGGKAALVVLLVGLAESFGYGNGDLLGGGEGI